MDWYALADRIVNQTEHMNDPRSAIAEMLRTALSSRAGSGEPYAWAVEVAWSGEVEPERKLLHFEDNAKDYAAHVMAKRHPPSSARIVKLYATPQEPASDNEEQDG